MSFLTNTDANVESACLGELFDLAAERFSASPAVVFNNEQLSYRELQLHINQSCNFLEAKVICNDTSAKLIFGNK